MDCHQELKKKTIWQPLKVLICGSSIFLSTPSSCEFCLNSLISPKILRKPCWQKACTQLARHSLIFSLLFLENRA